MSEYVPQQRAEKEGHEPCRYSLPDPKICDRGNFIIQDLVDSRREWLGARERSSLPEVAVTELYSCRAALVGPVRVITPDLPHVLCHWLFGDSDLNGDPR